MLNGTYPVVPLPPIPAILLEAFLAARRMEDSDDGGDPDKIETQRVWATLEGAERRALKYGALAGHAQQAAALLVLYQEYSGFLEGGLTAGGKDALLSKLDEDELEVLNLVKSTIVMLLDWHMKNGAGALLPIAEWHGLVWKLDAERRAA